MRSRQKQEEAVYLTPDGSTHVGLKRRLAFATSPHNWDVLCALSMNVANPVKHHSLCQCQGTGARSIIPPHTRILHTSARALPYEIAAFCRFCNK